MSNLLITPQLTAGPRFGGARDHGPGITPALAFSPKVFVFLYASTWDWRIV